MRKISSDGIITTVAGNGTVGFSGDGGMATNASLGRFFWSCNTFCGGVTVDSAGNLFIADSGNSRIRKVSPDGIITTVAGSGNPPYDLPFDYSLLGDGGLATSAQLFIPAGIAVDEASNLFIADDVRIRKVSPDGIITTIAGGPPGFAGDGGPATSARLVGATGVALDAAGNLFITTSDFEGFFDNERIRKISSDGIITTVAGDGTGGFSGDGGPATSARLRFPAGAAVDSAGNVYVADVFNHAVRLLSPADRTNGSEHRENAVSQRR